MIFHGEDDKTFDDDDGDDDNDDDNDNHKEETNVGKLTY